ncbi:hypothetical protein EVG20_g4344 [Dentipellis fragilis]|uniref:Fungal-type protein kinase domain-containing protein n=1 Tax=Dentipellis fragilis TaxID=205917 RepID=A0A4Y9YWG0_9AGAM|nr:hypothetical protein EVG20_g4344 [Dentipellis fragilis]
MSSGAFLGPMSPLDFLNHFVPAPVRRDSKARTRPDVSFQRMADVENETEMYSPYIEVCQQLDPKQTMEFHSILSPSAPNRTPFEECDEEDPKLDVRVVTYHRSKLPFDNLSEDFARAERVDVLKHDSSEDPFNEVPDDTIFPFESHTKGGKKVRGEIIAHTNAILQLQFRIFVFSIHIMGRKARLIRWDRSGAIVTEAFDYVEHPEPLAEFLWRYTFLSAAERGHDETVKSLLHVQEHPEDYHAALDAIRRIQDITERDNIELLLLRMSPLDARSPPMPPASDAKFYYKTDPAQECNGWDYYVTAPRMNVRRPFGKGTRSLLVYDRHTGRVHHLKDTNRLISPELTVEHEVINELRQAGAYRDILDPKLLPGYPDDPKGWEHLRAYRLITEEVGTLLWRFDNWKQVVQAIADTLEALDGAEKAGWRHRDISAANIMLFNGRGLLVDWHISQQSKFMDLASEDGKKRQDQTGSWQFKSVTQLRDPYARHDAKVNRESVFWVLLWMAINFSQHSMPPIEIKDNMWHVFDYEWITGEGHSKGGFGKECILSKASGRLDLYFAIEFYPPPLQHVLELMHGVLRYKYKIPQPPYIPEYYSEERVKRKERMYELEVEVYEEMMPLLEDPLWIHGKVVEILNTEEWPAGGPVTYPSPPPGDGPIW